MVVVVRLEGVIINGRNGILAIGACVRLGIVHI